jgi:hypothetical protein
MSHSFIDGVSRIFLGLGKVSQTFGVGRRGERGKTILAHGITGIANVKLCRGVVNHDNSTSRKFWSSESSPMWKQPKQTMHVTHASLVWFVFVPWWMAILSLGFFSMESSGNCYIGLAADLFTGCTKTKNLLLWNRLAQRLDWAAGVFPTKT